MGKENNSKSINSSTMGKEGTPIGKNGQPDFDAYARRAGIRIQALRQKAGYNGHSFYDALFPDNELKENYKDRWISEMENGDARKLFIALASIEKILGKSLYELLSGENADIPTNADMNQSTISILDISQQFLALWKKLSNFCNINISYYEPPYYCGGVSINISPVETWAACEENGTILDMSENCITIRNDKRVKNIVHFWDARGASICRFMLQIGRFDSAALDKNSFWKHAYLQASNQDSTQYPIPNHDFVLLLHKVSDGTSLQQIGENFAPYDFWNCPIQYEVEPAIDFWNRIDTVEKKE